MEYFQGCCGATAALLWSSASQGKEVIPSSQLFLPWASGNYRSNALNQYTSIGGQTLEYGGNFNLRSYAGATFTYNAQNQLVSGTKGTNTVQFLYDGLGRCLKRTTNGASIIFAYDGWKPLAEWAADGSSWGYRIYGAGPDEVLWHWDSRIGNRRVHSDMHGNVIALLDWYGNGIEKYTYDAFGTPKITDWAGSVRTTSAALNRFLFQGREYIGELGIYDYRHRMYLPSIGRFLQTDPSGFDAGDMNLYRYCGDDPVDRSDPMGLEGEDYTFDQAMRAARALVRKEAFGQKATYDPVVKQRITHGILVPVLRNTTDVSRQVLPAKVCKSTPQHCAVWWQTATHSKSHDPKHCVFIFVSDLDHADPED